MHAAIETAACRACVEACPCGAWHLDDTALEFNASRCDGCGLCVPACPGQAISLPLALAIRPLAGSHAVLAACAHAGAEASGHVGPGLVPCLHAIGTADLLRAYRAGQHAWLLAHGDCAACPRGQGETLFARVAHVNAALRQRGRRPMLTRQVSPATWFALVTDADAVGAQARRAFLRSLSRRPATLLTGTAAVTEAERTGAPGEDLPDGEDALMPWTVNLDAGRCVGCHACTRVCPRGAIEYDTAASAYRLRHRACTGCGLCRDVCAHRAVALRAWAEPTQWLLPLAERRCARCGVTYTAPTAAAGKHAHCWVCAAKQQPSRLYQVMA
ncbi:MAG: 4Fe-4S ferredoxin [bacterium]|nr:MAG: 4Fe-4S ferredoxin [bacterium]KAF0149592.1 MAG: 4Fe-4S ferredoxin [bacterium]KAF0169258.1 MAG: 4Fe-4S ferredoxin [bacterium]